jgi:iron complex outermembrane recepter protein
MRFKLLLTITALSSLIGTSIAQQTTGQTGGGELERITVTGYIVPRIGEGPQPVISFDKDYISKTGQQTVTDVLQNLPASVGNFNPNVTTGFGFSPGAASIGLKGLPPSDTLVLVDGQRFPVSALPQQSVAGAISFVDINAIPIAAIDRFEILNDGGSATYGSDAVGGVVNVILKDEYNGADLLYYYGISQRGDFEVHHTSLVGGFTQDLGKWGKLKLIGAFDYYEQSPISFVDRPFNRLDHSHYSSRYADLPNVVTPLGPFVGANTGNTYQVRPGSRAPITAANFDINDPGFILSDFNPIWQQIVPRETRYGGYAKVTWEPTNWLKFYDSFLIQYQAETSSYPNQGAYAPNLGNNGGIVVPANNPFNPFGEPLINQGQSLNEFGPLRAETEITTFRNVVGAIAQLPHNWYIDTSFVYGESDATYKQLNMPLVAGLNAALAGTLPGKEGIFFNPFTDQLLPNGPNKVFYNDRRVVDTIFVDNRSELASYNIHAGGTVWDLPSGTLSVAAGFEYRSEAFIQGDDANSHGGNVAANQNPTGELTHGRRYLKSVFGEVDVPILGDKWSVPGMRLLDGVFSYRYDDYSDFGESTKPKFALRYKPFNDVTFRATYSEGFVAPSLPQLFGTPLPAETTVNDPVTGNTGVSILNITRGNPNVKPQTSYGYFLNFTWSPGSADPEHSWWGWANGFTFYANWFEINLHNLIGVLTPQEIVNLGGGAPPGNFVVRNPTTGAIQTVNNTYTNLGNERIDGFEVGFTYKTKEYSWGKLDLDFSLSDIYHFTTLSIRGQAPNGKLRFQVLDRTDTALFVPDVKLLASIFYSKTLFGTDTFRTGITIHWLDSEDDFATNSNGTDPQFSSDVPGTNFVHQIGSWTTVDWQISYMFGPPAAPVAPEMPKPGYDKEGKRIVGEQAISPRKEGSSWGWRRLLDNTTFIFGINNIWDSHAPLSVDNNSANYDYSNANAIGRYFWFSVEKKF